MEYFNLFYFYVMGFIVGVNWKKIVKMLTKSEDKLSKENVKKGE